VARFAVGLDTETTGLDVREDRIIEICLGLYDLDTQQRRAIWTRRVQPNRKIDPKALAVHGITAEMLVGAPTFSQIAPDVVKLLNAGVVLVAHNGLNFDFPLLAHELMRCGLEVPVRDIEDTISARWATSDGKLPKLGELAFACGVDYDPTKAHAAEYDVDVMMACYFKAMDQGFFKKPGGGA
jgi:DNA polymerase III subunit epsilon